MRIDDVINLHDAISSLMAKKLPIKMAFAVQKNMKQLKEIVDFANEKQNDIVRRNAKRDDAGEFIQTEDGKGILINDQKAFVEEMEELLHTDMPVEFVKIPMSEVERCDEEKFDSLTPEEAGALEEMIEV